MEYTNLGVTKKMGQEDIITLLEKNPEALSLSEIADKSNCRKDNVSKILRSLIKAGDVIFEEIDKELALEKYNCKKPLRLYRTSYSNKFPNKKSNKKT